MYELIHSMYADASTEDMIFQVVEYWKVHIFTSLIV